jgi:hypothetical protein
MLVGSFMVSLSVFSFVSTYSSSTDPPEIVVDNPIVYSGEGQEATLSCIVHGETQPEVIT